MFPLEVRSEVNHQETRVQWKRRDSVLLRFEFLTQYQRDVRTDRQTADGFIIACTTLCIENYADAL